MVQVRALVSNPQGRLKSDMLVKAKLRLPTEQELMIPNSAILMLGDRQFVYRLTPKEKQANQYRVEQVEIETGQRGAKFTQVRSGLRQDDAIVSHGLMQVSEKRPAKIKVWQTDQKQSEMLQKKAVSNREASR